jgi:hypothetical protein
MQSVASVQVFTFKRGLLSAIAHDLRLCCERFEVTEESGRVRARFEPRSLRVEGVMQNARLDETALSPDQKREIFETIQGTILDTARHPEIVLEGDLKERGSRLEVDGTLTLRGVSRPIHVVGERSQERVRGEVELVPSQWGIKPYAALLGAIRLEDRVVVRFDLP